LENGVGLEGVQVTDGTRTATTAPSGAYVIADVPSDTYTVVPTKTNYTFTPTARTAVVASADATGVDFTATARTFSISGTVSDSEGNRLAGVKVEVQGGTSVAVTSQAGLYTLTGVKAGLRTIIASRDGYLFEPAPGVVLDNLNVGGDLTGIDIVGYPVLSRSFAAGTHFIGVPLTPRTDDAAQVFGTTDVARWAGTSSPPRYVTVATDAGHDALRVQPGAGFFVRFGAAARLAVAGAPVSHTAPYIFAVDEDWTMAANPFTSAIGFANLQPNIANTLAPYGFVLGPAGYVLVSNVPALGGRSYIDGWEGVWLQSNLQGATITALPPGAATAGVQESAQRVVDGQNWRIPIVARAAGTTDACTTVGISAATGALSAVNPPALPGVVDVVLQGAAGSALAADLKGQVGNGVAWDFSIIAPAPNTSVELTLPDLAEVPATLNVTLVDVAAGKRMAARMLPSYVYDSGQGGARQFRLEVTPRTTAGLTLRTTGAQPNPAAVAVSYVVSADATITAEVLNLAGRKVATLTRGATVSAGTNALTWNLTSENGTKVPAGRYLVRLEAATADGQRAFAVQSILVNR
jgi:hypothetical protein